MEFVLVGDYYYFHRQRYFNARGKTFVSIVLIEKLYAFVLVLSCISIDFCHDVNIVNLPRWRTLFSSCNSSF